MYLKLMRIFFFFLKLTQDREYILKVLFAIFKAFFVQNACTMCNLSQQFLSTHCSEI